MEPRPGDSGWAHAAHRRMHTSQAIRARATGYPELRSARYRHPHPSASKVAARASTNARGLKSDSQPSASRGSQAVKGLREGPRAPTLQPGNNGLGCLHALRSYSCVRPAATRAPQSQRAQARISVQALREPSGIPHSPSISDEGRLPCSLRILLCSPQGQLDFSICRLLPLLAKHANHHPPFHGSNVKRRRSPAGLGTVHALTVVFASADSCATAARRNAQAPRHAAGCSL